MELNQDTQDEYFNRQEECNTLSEEFILSISCKTNLWLLPLAIFSQQTSDYPKTISPAHLEIDFLIDPRATLDVLNNEWNEIIEYHNLQLKASKFVLSAAKISQLQSQGSLKLNLYPDVTEYRSHQNVNFTLIFYVSNTEVNILGTPFLDKICRKKLLISHARD